MDRQPTDCTSYSCATQWFTRSQFEKFTFAAIRQTQWKFFFLSLSAPISGYCSNKIDEKSVDTMHSTISRDGTWLVQLNKYAMSATTTDDDRRPTTDDRRRQQSRVEHFGGCDECDAYDHILSVARLSHFGIGANAATRRGNKRLNSSILNWIDLDCVRHFSSIISVDTNKMESKTTQHSCAVRTYSSSHSSDGIPLSFASNEHTHTPASNMIALQTLTGLATYGWESYSI